MTDSEGRAEVEHFFGILEDATETFNIWQACQEAHGDEATVNMFNDVYPGVFIWIEHALLANSVNHLYFLNERRSDTLNFGTLIARFEPSLSDVSATELREKAEQLKPTWRKLSVLRNEIFAHRTSQRSIDDSFNKANISPSEIESYIAQCQFIVQRLGVVRFGVTYHFNSGSNRTMSQLLNDLRSNNSFKPKRLRARL